MNILVSNKSQLTQELVAFTSDLISLNHTVFWNLADQKIDFELVSKTSESADHAFDNLVKILSDDNSKNKISVSKSQLQRSISNSTNLVDSTIHKLKDNSSRNTNQTSPSTSISQFSNITNTQSNLVVDINSLFVPADFSKFELLKYQPSEFGFAQFKI